MDKFVNSIVARGAEKDFVATKLSFKVSEFLEYINQNKKLIENNDGWLRIEVLKSKNDRNKHYCTLNDWVPNKVASRDHSPDRDTADDTPF